MGCQLFVGARRWWRQVAGARRQKPLLTTHLCPITATAITPVQLRGLGHSQLHVPLPSSDQSLSCTHHHCPYSYEAWVIYNFMSLCLAYVGGPGAVEVKMHGFVLLPSWPAGTCCLPPLPVNGRFVRYTKQMALQFVLTKPIMAALTIILYATGHYEEGDWAPNNGCVGSECMGRA